jgi:hypothetical protein
MKQLKFQTDFTKLIFFYRENSEKNVKDDYPLTTVYTYFNKKKNFIIWRLSKLQYSNGEYKAICETGVNQGQGGIV